MLRVARGNLDLSKGWMPSLLLMLGRLDFLVWRDLAHLASLSLAGFFHTIGPAHHDVRSMLRDRRQVGQRFEEYM